MTISVRAAEAPDVDRRIELLLAPRKAPKDTPADGERAVFERLLNHERGEVFVAVDGDTVLGMATVSYNLAMRYKGEYCQLEELIVDPAARGQNAGGLLVQHTIDNARQRGCAEYGLYLVERTEHNRPFYERYGMEVVGTEMRQSLL
tara:strand:- start:2736 stop:3176 length:441 start_codon:yes stop_codon:yes gene_type:complete